MKSIYCFFLLLIPTISWGQSFDSVVNFNLELSSLNNPAVVRNAVEDGRIVILEGFMSTAETNLSDNNAGVVITLIGGEWIGTSDVQSYACRIRFNGSQWMKTFSEDGSIPEGSRLLIAARVTGFFNNTMIPEADMISFRVLH